MTDRTHFGYADPNPKRTPADKLVFAIAAFRDATGQEPTYCLVHPETAAGLVEASMGPAPIRIEGESGINRANFYLGED